MKKRNAIFILAWLTVSILCSGMTRVYEEKTKEQTTTHRFAFEPAASGYSITLDSETGNTIVKQRFIVDKNLNTLSWAFENPVENTKVTASRSGNKIFLDGRSKGKPVKKTFAINEYPWNQAFNIGLEPFALSPENSMLFWAIGTKGPGNMKITKFKVKKQKTETITLKSEKVEAVYLTISLTGMLSIFWTGNYWFRKSDGRFLRYKGKSGPGSGNTIMELISESY